MVDAAEATRKGPYSLECFRDTALRRGREARTLLEASKRACDGAVTCSLLATECALKAALLFGHGVMYDHELPKELYDRHFRSKYGHALMELYRAQTATVRRKEATPLDEVTRLAQRDRYEHRYGHRRPVQREARPVVDDAQVVIDWMGRILL